MKTTIIYLVCNTCMRKHRIIFLNNNLVDYILKIILAHEIGHDTYHRNLAKTVLKELILLNMKNDTEYVANAFGSLRMLLR